MALAVLRHDGWSDRGARFRAFLGSNRYFGWAVGEKERRRIAGRKVLARVASRSRLMGPAQTGAAGTLIEVPAQHFGPKIRWVQLFSFSDAQLNGPAFSEIIAVPPRSPSFSFTQTPDSPATPSRMTMEHVEKLDYSYRPDPMAEAMIFGAIAGMVPQLLGAAAPMLQGILGNVAPQLGNILGGLLGGGKGGAKAGGAPAKKQDLAKLFESIFQSLVEAKGLGPSAHVQGLQLADAQAIPLLAMLMPAIQKLLTPETIKGLLDAPNKTISTTTKAAVDLMKAVDKSDEVRAHLEKLMPSMDDPALDKLLEGMSLQASMSGELTYKRVDTVSLAFAEQQGHEIDGRLRVLYQLGRDLSFALSVETPKTIGRARLHLVLTDSRGKRAQARAHVDLTRVSSGPLARAVRFPASALEGLAANEDYILTATLVWRNSKGRKRGTSRISNITLVGEAIYDRLEEGGRLVALNDLTRFRAFSHRLLQVDFDDSLRRMDLRCRYLYVLEIDRRNNGRMPTRVRIDSKKRRRHGGRLSGGMVLSPPSLSRLVTLLGGVAPSAAELQALATRDFADAFSQAARASVTLRGARGETGALWVYPEVRLVPVVLKVASSVDANGMVLSLEEKTIEFPVPAVVHFVSVNPGEAGRGDRALAGMEIEDDQKVSSYPTPVIKHSASEVV